MRIRDAKHPCGCNTERQHNSKPAPGHLPTQRCTKPSSISQACWQLAQGMPSVLCDPHPEICPMNLTSQSGQFFGQDPPFSPPVRLSAKHWRRSSYAPQRIANMLYSKLFSEGDTIMSFGRPLSSSPRGLEFGKGKVVTIVRWKLKSSCGAVVSTQEAPYLSGPGFGCSRPLLQSRQRQLRQIYLLFWPLAAYFGSQPGNSPRLAARQPE